MEEYVGELDHTQWMLFVVAEKAGTAGNSDIHTVPPFFGDDVASFLLMLSALLSVRPDHVGSSWPPWFLTPRPSLEEKLHRMPDHAYIHVVPFRKGRTSRRTRLRRPLAHNQLLRCPKLEPTRYLPLENAPRIILATHIPQPLLDLRSIPADNILATIRVVQILVRVVQTRFVLDAGFLFDVVEEPDGGVLRQDVVGRVVPGGGQEAVDEGAVGGRGEAEGVAAQGPGARCYEWGDGLDGEGPLDSGDGFYEGDGGVPEGVDAVEEGAGVFKGGGAIELALNVLVIWLDVDENLGRGKEGERG